MKKHVIFVFTILICMLLSSCKNRNYIGDERLKIRLKNVVNLDVHNDIINQYLNDEQSYFVAIKYANGTKNKYDSKPVVISWDSKTDGKHDIEYKVVIRNAEYNEEIEMVTQDTRVEFYNPYINTTYDYDVIGYVDKEETLKASSSFEIATKKVRTIVIDGIMNCRDLGGYKTVDGKTVKQGLLYRTARFNEADEKGYKELITAKGLEQYRGLKLKTELDLRGEDESAFRKDNHPYVDNYYLCPTQFEGTGTLFNKEFLKGVFDVLGNESNYPLFFHCAIGTDRTGLIAFLVEAILGVDKTDMYYDYMLSNFSNIGSSRSITAIENYISIIDYDDELTLKEQTIDFLVNNIGIDQSKIENIQRLLLK